MDSAERRIAIQGCHCFSNQVRGKRIEDILIIRSRYLYDSLVLIDWKIDTKIVKCTDDPEILFHLL